MVKVSFERRIFCDDSFIEWLLSHPNKIPVMLKLIRIKKVCKDCKEEHNVITDFDYKKVKNLPKSEYLLRGAVKEVPTDFLEEFEPEIKDDITKRIIIALLLLDQEPYSVYIFTSPQNKSKYQDHSLLVSMKSSVKIKGGEEAVEIIEEFYRKFIRERELSRA